MQVQLLKAPQAFWDVDPQEEAEPSSQRLLHCVMGDKESWPLPQSARGTENEQNPGASKEAAELNFAVGTS